jgi:RNA recognition motif-containing protein
MSSSSSSSSSPEPSSPIPKKRKRKDVAIPEPDASDSDSDASDTDAESTPVEPVLSHAERRRQKRAAKREEKEVLSSKRRKLEDGKAIPVPAAKRKNSVWVGNMSFKTTQENLREFFKDVGEVTRIYMPTKPGANPAMKPENRGSVRVSGFFCYIFIYRPFQVCICRFCYARSQDGCYCALRATADWS